MREPVELTFRECLDLLGAGMVGRLALSTPVGPRIVPVNYALIDDSLLFRTTPYSELATYGSGSEVAFEIDHLDYERQRGWSVVALGRLRPVEPDELDDLRKVWDPRPWAGGMRTFYLELPWRDLSGRRIGNDWTHATMTPVRRVL